MMTASNRQLTGSDLNHTGKAEDSPCTQRSDRSWRVGGTWRARWPWAPAHREVSVTEEQRDLWCTDLSSRSSPLSPPSCRLLAAWLSPRCKFSALKRQSTLLAHYHSSHSNSTTPRLFVLSLNSLWLPSTPSHTQSHTNFNISTLLYYLKTLMPQLQ